MERSCTMLDNWGAKTPSTGGLFVVRLGWVSTWPRSQRGRSPAGRLSHKKCPTDCSDMHDRKRSHRFLVVQYRIHLFSTRISTTVLYVHNAYGRFNFSYLSSQMFAQMLRTTGNRRQNDFSAFSGRIESCFHRLNRS